MESKTRGSIIASNLRANKTIWRIAEWLYDCFYCSLFDTCSSKIRDEWYDKAAELMKKIQMNEFTGEDTHKD